MSKPLQISIVMPSFNQAVFVRQAIESILSQDYPHRELLVMDGGSTDGTVEILESFGDDIRFVSAPDRGQSDALNRGLAQLDGDVLCWLNSDDFFVAGALSAVAAAFEQSPDVEFVYGNGWNVDEQGRLIGDVGVLPFDCWRLINQRNFIQQASCFFRRSLFEKVGPIDESLHYVMDWELWIRFAVYRGQYIEEHLSANRLYGDTKTQSGGLARWREIREMIRRYAGRRWPPVLGLYLLEAAAQSLRTRRSTRGMAALPSKAFMFGMGRQMSGRFADGGVSPRFRCSVGNPGGHSEAGLRFIPLSAYDSRRRGLDPIQLRWTTSGGASGGFQLVENGEAQVARVPIAEQGFTHLKFQADWQGEQLAPSSGLPRRRIVGYLDEIAVL